MILIPIFLSHFAIAEPSASCLGEPSDCYSYLPRVPRPYQYASIEGLSESEILSFLSDPEVCTLDKLYRLHPSLEIRTLAALQGGIAQAQFDKAPEQVQVFLNWCGWTQSFITSLPASYAPKEFRKYMLSLVNDYYPQAGAIFEDFPRSDVVLDEKYPRSIASLLTEYTHKIVDLVEPAAPQNREEVLALTLKLAMLLRQAVENFRMLLGVKTTMREIVTLHPWLAEDLNRLPTITFHNEIYGRHWDVIEALIASRGVDFFVEIGVALGAVGLVTLERFPGLRYLGIDPTIRNETKEVFAKYTGQAVLLDSTSSAVVHGIPDQSAGLVFIDGPHTYVQVSTDISEWLGKVKPGGWLAGHDFTAQHPPLVWAVIEQALVHGIHDIHVGMDGVWWWDSEAWTSREADNIKSDI